jgi:hypothetical protein
MLGKITNIGQKFRGEKKREIQEGKQFTTKLYREQRQGRKVNIFRAKAFKTP